MIRRANFLDKYQANTIHREAYPIDAYCYAENIDRFGTINLVYELEGRVVGFVSVLVDPPRPEGPNLWERMRPYIAFLGVASDARQRGIGKALVMEVSRRACSQTRSDYIYLECEQSNTVAQRLYEGTGFEQLSPDVVRAAFGGVPRSSFVYRASSSSF